LWLHSLKVAQLLRSAACLHTNQSRSYLNHLVYHKYTICEPNEFRLCCNQRNVLDPLLHLSVFLSLYISTAVDAFVIVWRTEPAQPLSAAHIFDPSTFISYMQVVFPALTAYIFRIFSCVLITNN